MGRFQSEEELWARLEELERQEEMLGELDRYSTVLLWHRQGWSSESCKCVRLLVHRGSHQQSK